MVHADAASDLENRSAPLRLPVIADHVLRAQSFEPAYLRLTSGDREDPRTRGECKLQREYAHSAGTLHQHRLSGLEVADLEKRIPRCQGRSRERRRFLERQRIRNLDEAALIPAEVFCKDPIDRATERRVPV